MNDKILVLVSLAFLTTTVFGQSYTEITEGGWGQGINESDPAITDIDHDGLLDLIVGCRDGRLYHYEQETEGSTSFQLITDFFNDINVNEGTSVTFTDIDNDGLLDMMVGNVVGELAHFEQNSNGSTDFTLVTRKFNDIDAGTRCLPAFTDFDGDGLLDMLIGEYDGNLNYYEQEAAGSNSFSLVTETFCDIDVGLISRPCFSDMDGDGLLDMIIGSDDGLIHHYKQESVHSGSFELVSDTLSGIAINGSAKPCMTDLDGNGLLDMIVGSFEGDLLFYEQDEAGSVTFSLKKPRLVQIDAMKLESRANPALTDLDGDGLLDLIKGTGSRIMLYEQDEAGSPFFTLQMENFLKVDYAAPCIYDLDGNGQLDMLIGTWHGILLYEQDAPGSLSFTEKLKNPCGTIDIYAVAPCIADLDNDTRLDLIIGDAYGKLHHFQQDSVGSSTFSLITDFFNDIEINGNICPTFTDIDDDGLLDLIIGTRYATLVHYEQTTYSSMEFTLMTDKFNNLDFSDFGAPEFADINGDGEPDLIVGEAYGGIHYLQRTDVSQVEGKNITPLAFTLYPNYPNPFNSGTTIQYDLSRKAWVNLCIYNSQGQRVRTLYDNYLPEGSFTIRWDGKNENGIPLSSGFYLCRLRAGEFWQTIQLLLTK